MILDNHFTYIICVYLFETSLDDNAFGCYNI